MSRNDNTRNKSLFNCLICYFSIDTNHTFLPCSCKICQDCLYEWIKTQNEESLHLDNIFLTCPNSECKKKFDYDWVINNLSKEKQNEMNDILFLKYLNNNNDVIKCPKKGCRFAGFKSKSSICRGKYKCELCAFEWKGTEVEDYFSENIIKDFVYGNIYSNIKSFVSWFPNEFSELRVGLLCKPCYHCQRNVYKFTGCKHITCICKREFCYTCLQNWNGHISSYCDGKENLCVSIILYLFMVTLFKIVFSFDIIITTIKLLLLGICFQCAGIFTALGAIISSVYWFYFITTSFSQPAKPIIARRMNLPERMCYTVYVFSNKFLIFTKLLFSLLYFTYLWANYYFYMNSDKFACAVKLILWEVGAFISFFIVKFILKLVYFTCRRCRK